MKVKTYQVIGITPPTVAGREPTGGILALYDPEQGEFDPTSSRVHLWRWSRRAFPLDRMTSTDEAVKEGMPTVPKRTVHWQSAMAHSTGYGPFVLDEVVLPC